MKGTNKKGYVRVEFVNSKRRGGSFLRFAKEKLAKRGGCGCCGKCSNRGKALNLTGYRNRNQIIHGGKGILSKAFQKASNIYRRRFCQGKSRPLYEGEYHVPCHNYSGPGTVINAETLKWKPYNDIDACSRQHDLDYTEAQKEPDKGKRAKLIRIADEKVLRCYENFPHEQGYRLSKLGIGTKVRAEDFIPKILGEYAGHQ
jgi:hypothetical protein